ncbi:hypothetical protein EOL70_12640 [Leucothrix sargassi]|nr:hypothetical protein EOL70_12640 [Leucothrix sargassi]
MNTTNRTLHTLKTSLILLIAVVFMSVDVAKSGFSDKQFASAVSQSVDLDASDESSDDPSHKLVSSGAKPRYGTPTRFTASAYTATLRAAPSRSHAIRAPPHNNLYA